MKLHFT